MVKKLSRALAALGGIIVLTGIIGRFYGAPTVMGHTTTSMLIVANTCLLFSLIVKDLRR